MTGDHRPVDCCWWLKLQPQNSPGRGSGRSWPITSVAPLHQASIVRNR